MKHNQPAKTSYYFHGGFVELRQVITGVFKRFGDTISDNTEELSESAGDAFSRAKDVIGDLFDFDFMEVFRFLISLFKLGYFIAKLIFTAVFTTLICGTISIIQISVLLTFFSVGLIFFGIIILTDRIYCTINAIASHCPVCQEHFYMPVYVCPNCNKKHTRLRPGIYGILKRECNCGKKLSTTFINGRQKLQAECPHCESNVKDGGLQASWCIPVIGGPGSGKTCYINMTMMSLEKNSQSKYGLKFVYENNGLDEYEDNSARLSKGYLPEKTTDYRLRYYQFSLTPDKATKQLISLCDVAGELFDINTSGGEINKQIGFRYANAFMLIIDPLSIPDYRSEVSKVINLKKYKGSVQRLDEMIDTFVRTLQNMFSIKANAMLDTDVAVVFTKTDIPGLAERIGESAVLKNAPDNEQKTLYKTKNELCEKFLQEYNEENFLKNLKSRFRSIQFFTCSALGHIENGQPFTASDVEEPFYWLVRKKSKVINNAIK